MQERLYNFLQSQKNLLNVRKPAFCCFDFLPRCMLRCKMCFAWKSEYVEVHQRPTLNDCYNFIAALGDLSDKSIEINFAGGEPLLDDRTLPLIRFSANKDLPTSINTNGFLINEAMAYKIANSGFG